jgi:hypothetical protein
MQSYIEVAIFAKKMTKDRVSITIGKQQLNVVIRDEQVLFLHPKPVKAHAHQQGRLAWLL